MRPTSRSRKPSAAIGVSASGPVTADDASRTDRNTATIVAAMTLGTQIGRLRHTANQFRDVAARCSFAMATRDMGVPMTAIYVREDAAIPTSNSAPGATDGAKPPAVIRGSTAPETNP